jgi:thymidylate synthase (FAD)
MKIVKPYARMISSFRYPYEKKDFSLAEGIAKLRSIEYFARISHRSEDRITTDSYDKFLRSIVLQHGDFSVIEHESVAVEALVDRGITHEWVRHRIGSYTQESTRFVNYEKGGQELKFINPFDSQYIQATQEVMNQWENSVAESVLTYKFLIENGATPQIARSVLPNALASKIVVTYNLRNWRHFFIMRTSKETHPQFKQVTIPLLRMFKDMIPILFEDIEPEMRQADAMRNLK